MVSINGPETLIDGVFGADDRAWLDGWHLDDIRIWDRVGIRVQGPHHRSWGIDTDTTSTVSDHQESGFAPPIGMITNNAPIPGWLIITLG